MFADKYRPIVIGGRAVEFCWTLEAQLALFEQFGMKPSQFAEAYGSAVASGNDGEMLSLFRKLFYAGTRSADKPPSLKEIGRMTGDEWVAAVIVARTVISDARGGGLPDDEKKDAKKNGEAASDNLNGTGASCSAQPSTAAESGPANSGSSPSLSLQ